jgi:hypothetical protein
MKTKENEKLSSLLFQEAVEQASTRATTMNKLSSLQSFDRGNW